MKLCDLTIQMELEKLEALVTETGRVYQKLEESKVSRDHKLVMAYQYHLHQLEYIKKYRGTNENLHNR